MIVLDSNHCHALVNEQCKYLVTSRVQLMLRHRKTNGAESASTEMKLPSAIDQASRCMGIQGLKPKQLEALESFVSGKDTFVALPTGYGKSIIFAILSLLFDFLFGKPMKTALLI